METAKVFMNGRSEAVRLPKNCRFGSNEVYVKRVGDLVLLIPKEKTWQVFMQSLDGFSQDFLAERIGKPAQKRLAL
jgi:antitoxin VapB